MPTLLAAKRALQSPKIAVSPVCGTVVPGSGMMGVTFFSTGLDTILVVKSFVPSVAGLILAGEVVRELCGL